MSCLVIKRRSVTVTAKDTNRAMIYSANNCNDLDRFGINLPWSKIHFISCGAVYSCEIPVDPREPRSGVRVSYCGFTCKPGWQRRSGTGPAGDEAAAAPLRPGRGATSGQL